MISSDTLQAYGETLDEIRTAGLFKQERALGSPQGPRVRIDGTDYLNLCTNDYLGLAAHPEVVAAARAALEADGFGMASVRFISGTHEQHRAIEHELTSWLGTEDTILFPSCFDANGGVFETLLEAEDAVISDELNHASIIDGVRLSKAQRFRYRNRDMADLEAQLTAASGARRRLIVTDGVFSMDGYLAPLDELVEVAERHDAMVMVDDSHAAGILGATGAGTPELFGVRDRVDLVSGTLGKALGGASGGYISGRGPLIELLRQRARPYLFSNAVPPMVVAGSRAAIALARAGVEARAALAANAARFRGLMTDAGFDLLPGEHAIVPVMIPDATEALELAGRLGERGIYVRAFAYPVVPLGRARLRVQLSAAHTLDDMEFAAAEFIAARS
ncbi:MAG TPA: glycine C-acetyltransferase [Pseudolysinimonas sp.]|nr:glycine C-acetyltransferase [Pseudolysinimonas sp.]